jgi:hypothetical protein
VEDGRAMPGWYGYVLIDALHFLVIEVAIAWRFATADGATKNELLCILSHAEKRRIVRSINYVNRAMNSAEVAAAQS